MEVILISSDHNQDEFERSRRSLGPGVFALPFASSSSADDSNSGHAGPSSNSNSNSNSSNAQAARRAMLSNMFDTLGVPTLVLLDPDHRVVNRNARALVERRRNFPWVPKLVPEVDEKDEWGAPLPCATARRHRPAPLRVPSACCRLGTLFLPSHLFGQFTE